MANFCAIQMCQILASFFSDLINICCDDGKRVDVDAFVHVKYVFLCLLIKILDESLDKFN